MYIEGIAKLALEVKSEASFAIPSITTLSPA
jgi:hypothetical protein